MTQVTTYYLEMFNASDINEKPAPEGLKVIEAELNEFRLNRFLYQLIGEQWQWTDKLKLSDEQWRAYVEDPNLRTWIAYYKGTIAGYFELNALEDGNTEIAYFGLAPNFIGKGFGGYLLSETLKQAWRIPSTKRVWVHTCTLDHESALSNYQARGLSIYKTQTSNT